MTLLVDPQAVIADTYRNVLPSRFNSVGSTVLLHAIGLQESRFETRYQDGGPARGFWQFERGGGTAGVLTHPVTSNWAAAVCVLRRVVRTSTAVYDRLALDDYLACAFARLLLYSDPRSLPPLGNAEAAWDYYLDNWRPGKPHRQTWDAYYSAALAASHGALPL